MEWTEEQKRVIEHRKGNLLVSAAAGSGKTAVLVERILQMVMDFQNPTMIDRMLVVTFTNAAAAQMKEKIRDKLQQALEADPENLFLQEQQDRMAQASIMTIHAFCLQVIRDYITRIPELDPGFRVGDETEMELLRSDILAQILEEWYLQWEEEPEKNSDFMSFVEAYGGSRQDGALEELLLRVYGYAENMPDPEMWLQEAIEAYSPEQCADIRETVWYEGIKEILIQHIHNAIGAYGKARERIDQQAVDEKKGRKADDLIAEIEEALETVLEGAGKKSVEELTQEIKAVHFPARMVYPFEDGEEKTQFRALTEKAKEEVKEAAALWERVWNDDARERMFQRAYPALRGMGRVLERFREEYQKVKTEQNILEFSDFEHYALRILRDTSSGVPTAAAQTLRQQYDCIYIDEYQDSNWIQELILTAIARTDEKGSPQNIFMVGDVKQSIYRFRHADPMLFLQKYETYGTKEGTDCYLLTKNFRSRPEILHAVNQVFEAIMSREAGEMSYGEQEQLNPGASFPPKEGEPRVILHVLSCDKGMDSRRRFQAEAEWIANDIEDNLQKKMPIWDGDQYRPIQKKDIVILLRSVTGRADGLREQLEKRQIDCYAESEVSFFDTPEIRLMIKILQVIDNPHQDIPLVGVMYSPIFNFTGNELAQLRFMEKEGEYWAAVQNGRQSQDKKLGKKVRRFWEQLEAWREKASNSSIHDLLWQIYQDSGYYLYVSAMPGGDLRRANLDLLLEKSIEFEQGIYSGLFQFLRFVDKLERNQKQMDEAKTLGEGEQVIRIMSIHKSKGLEFPVVYLAGLGSEFNRRDQEAPLLLHSEWGIGAMAIEPEDYLRYTTLPREVIRERIRRETLAEEMRVLYVAMTRAKEALILTGARIQNRMEEESDPKKEWRMPPWETLQANSYLDWIEKTVKRRTDTGIAYCLHQAELSEDTEARARAVEAERKTEEADPGESFQWIYPYQEETRMGIRFSVSEIKKHGDPEEETEDLSIPLVKGEKEGALKGTVVHTFLANADFNRLQETEEINRQIQEIEKKGILSKEERSLLEPKELLRFGRSSLCQRIRHSSKVRREQPFIVSFSLKEMNILCPGWISAEGKESESRIMVQGIIDCFFEEDGAIILVDYKTDRTIDELRLNQYKRQLRLYQAAIERTTGMKVKERMLYHTRTGEEIFDE